MANHIADRGLILDSLREELVGPSPQGEAIDTSHAIRFPDASSSYGPWRQTNGEEILQRDRPFKRYGIGVLYPLGTSIEVDPPTTEEAVDQPGAVPDEDDVEVLTDSAAKDLERAAQAAEVASVSRLDADPDDFDLTQANEYRPSTMAVSFLLKGAEGTDLEVRLTGGRYRKRAVAVAAEKGPDREYSWWLRSPVSVEAHFDSGELVTGNRRRAVCSDPLKSNVDKLDLEVSVFTRPWGERSSLVTVSVTNRSVASGASDDERALFQCRFEARLAGGATDACILPYPSSESVGNIDPEQASFDLLYRDVPVYAVGHGCAADWTSESVGKATAVTAECLPAFETPSITPVLRRGDGTRVEIPMAPLAGLDPTDDGWAAIDELLELYDEWLQVQERRVGPPLTSSQREVANRHLETCVSVLARMRQGASFLRTDDRAARAFQLANHAMLLQQVRSRPVARRIDWDSKNNRALFDEPPPSGDLRAPGVGLWRPFQIAFLLLAAESACSGESSDRDIVELIWFPTGGGKTEAYLGLAAFSLFHRRLKDPEDDGVGVLMRYTLRLLTAQQFQRAASLVCAMEYLRQSENDLGPSSFSIGIWVGAASTPNNRTEARRLLRKLVRGERNAENKFGLLRCPWCAAQMGPFSATGKTTRSTPKVAGYSEAEGTVRLECPDPKCYFSDGLPVYVVDEDIYEIRPSLVIGTVDKFATLAWNPTARTLFGLDEVGDRASSPPSLIIQDELHLISGPLGSMVGLYEAVIEELCTDRRGEKVLKPKIVGSTATIRRFEDQVRALYGRTRTELFPPRALDAGDSFFARYATDENGALLPGRLYVGVHGGGLGSVQTAQVRTFSALLQAPVPMSPEERDPWWSLIVFFNSLRELGTSLSLLQSDIPDYLKVLRNRLGLHPKDVRRLRRILELTGRMRGDEVPLAIEQLSVAASDAAAVDVSIASNIMEVGIDIDRLSLMTVVGQPKTTSQYIQVTGRIGRQWQTRPGLIVTIYSPSKPRDRSHFEKFRSYHERLYAQVEPTSVTPFSPPVLQRALHAVMVSFVRQRGPSNAGPYPPPEEVLKEFRTLVRDRVSAVDKEELVSYDGVFDERLDEWLTWQRTVWSGDSSGDIPLLRRAGEYASRTAALLSWATPTSMRNVDAECQAEITRLYILDQGGDGNA